MSTLSRLKSTSFIILMLILQVIVYFVVYVNIPTARVIVCLLYFTFIPGIVILKLLSMKNLSISERIFFSVGLSVAFLMIVGALINGLANIAFNQPLSLNVLLLSINTIVLILSFFTARQSDSEWVPQLELKNLKMIFLLLVSASIILLGAYGIFVVSIGGASLYLMMLVIVISIIVSIVYLSDKIIPSSYYPLILLVICVCALFFVGTDTALFSKYITGNGDYWIEFYAFKNTLNSHFWNSAALNTDFTTSLFPTYSMMSVTILPTILSVITGLEDSFLFKIFCPLIVCFIALGSYKFYQTQTDSKVAFLATFFLITISLGKGWGSGKQEIADLFYVALILLLFRKDIPATKRNILFIIFGAGLVLSHYGITFIFLLTMLSAFIILAVLNFVKTSKFSIFQNKIPLGLLLIFSVTTFTWYTFVNGSAALTLLSNEMSTVAGHLNEFFDPTSRGTALAGLGLVQTTSIFNTVSTVLFLSTEFLLVIGFIKIMMNRKKDSKFSIEYKVFAAINMAIIAVNILLPSIADTFVMSRFYQTTLFILAPLAILGGKAIIDALPKIKIQKYYAVILAFLVFIPLFLFQTGFVFEATKVPSSSYPMSEYRMGSFGLYLGTVDSQEVASAQWIPSHFNVTNIYIYTDSVSRFNVLTAYGLIERGRVGDISNITRPSLNQLLYLGSVEMIHQGYILNITEVPSIVQHQNTIYSNGESVILKGLGT
jgi:uncharacterized membrane protein